VLATCIIANVSESSCLPLNCYLTEANKYQTIIENAQKADGIVRQKYHESKRGIQLLCLPENELKKAVPSASPVASLRDHEASCLSQLLRCKNVVAIGGVWEAPCCS